jgi:uncharacterized caspase-like protein
VDAVRAFVEARLSAEQRVCAPSADAVIEAPLMPGINRVSLVAFDDNGVGSNAATVDVVRPAAAAPTSDLWVVAVGVSRYPRLSEASQLPGARDDADDLASRLGTLAGESFRRVHVEKLLDDAVTPTSINHALGALVQMKPDDVAIVLFAGHGAKLGAGADMVFLTGAAELSQGGLGVSRSSLAVGALTWSAIAEQVNRAPGRVLVLLDACHAGHFTQELVVRNDELARAMASGRRAGVVVFAAAKGRQPSLELGGTRGLAVSAAGAPSARDGRRPNGVFTAALLDGLDDPATDRNGDGWLQLSEIIDQVTDVVSVASQGAQTPWVARRELFGDYAVARAHAAAP